MLYRRATLLAAVAFVACWSESSEVIVLGHPTGYASGRIVALTYNVAGLPEGISSSSPSRHSGLISPLLNDHDLVLLQEDFCYHEQITAATRHPFRTLPQAAVGTLLGDGLTMLSALPLHSFCRVRWIAAAGLVDGFHDRWAAKGFSSAVMTLAPGVTVDVYNLHADAGFGAADQLARERSFDQLADHILRHSGRRAVLVGGDFNMTWSCLEDRALLQRFLDRTGLRDVATTLGQRDPGVDRYLFRSGGGLDLVPVAREEAAEFVTAAGEPLSDHPAIRVEFAWLFRGADVDDAPPARGPGASNGWPQRAVRGPAELQPLRQCAP